MLIGAILTLSGLILYGHSMWALTTEDRRVPLPQWVEHESWVSVVLILAGLLLIIWRVLGAAVQWVFR